MKIERYFFVFVVLVTNMVFVNCLDAPYIYGPLQKVVVKEVRVSCGACQFTVTTPDGLVTFTAVDVSNPSSFWHGSYTEVAAAAGKCSLLRTDDHVVVWSTENRKREKWYTWEGIRGTKNEAFSPNPAPKSPPLTR